MYVLEKESNYLQCKTFLKGTGEQQKETKYEFYSITTLKRGAKKFYSKPGILKS